MSRSSKLVLGLFLSLLVIVTLLRVLQVYSDFLWFGELGQSAVITKIWAVRLQLALLVGVVFFLWLWGNLRLARRLTPKEEVIGQRLLPDAERAQIERHIDKVLLAFAALVGLLTGITASGRWPDWLKFLNAVPFGKADPLFGRDAGFYVFRLPLYEYFVGMAFWAAVVGFVCATLVHLYNESIRVHGRTIKATRAAQAHCLALLALCFLIQAARFRLGMYALLVTPGGAVPGGPGFSSVTYRLPVYWIQIGACIVCAGLTLASGRLNNLRLPGFLLIGLILVGLLGGLSFPAIMERFVVKPNALAREPKYLDYNIEATNYAWGLADVVEEPHNIKPALTNQDVGRAAATLANVRIWDDRPLEDTYRQQQALRQYYEFSGVDVDRYAVNGSMRQVSISARQIDYERVASLWPNRHLQYTHGYGLCVSPVNMVDSEGLPHYWVRNFPPRAEREAAGQTVLDIAQPGLYFMEHALVDPYGYGMTPAPPARGQGPGGPEGGAPPAEPPQPAPDRRQTRRNISPLEERQIKDDYVIVRSGVEEIDYPTGDKGEDTAKTTYSGKAGVPMRGLLRRLAFFAKWLDLPLLFYDLGPDSRIIYNRWVPDRIVALAPFLLADPDPYPVVVDKRIVWIVDCYTIASRYPYSTAAGRGVGYAPNYVRNSVKATVDAYDGTTTLYLWDEKDPVVLAYQKAFPALFTPRSEMPATVRAHVRYPQGLFELQTQMYKVYHQQDAITFFQNEDAWSIPSETLVTDERPVEPYYVQMSLPGEAEAEFLLMRPFTPVNREKQNMIAWMAARCDEGHYGELRLYRFPKMELSYGPMQIEARISQNEYLADFFRLKSESNQIIRGHLLVVPVGGSLLYVEPIYLEAKLNPVPKLSLVAVASSSGIGYGQTFGQALAMLLGRQEAAPTAGESSAVPAPTGSVPDLANRLSAIYVEAEKLRMQGDLAGYAEKVKALGPLIEELRQAAKPGA